MHKIDRIYVKNYRSIVESEFYFSLYTPLVGYNNAGKTNLLSALSWSVRRTSLTATDFNDPSESVVVEADIVGITGEVLDALEDKHRAKVEPLIADGMLKIRRTQSKPGVSVNEIRIEIWADDKDGKTDWRLSPTGIEAAISHLFPDPIFVGAMENATDDVGKFSTTSTIGKLIREIVEPITEAQSGEIAEALKIVENRLSADGEKKDQHLAELDDQMQREVDRFFPGITVRTHVPTPTLADFLKGATIRIGEAGREEAEKRDASSFGHGTQRSVQMALIKCLAEIRRQAKGTRGRTTLLLIDEPELYLHPQAVELIRVSLKELSRDGYQVAFSTHSSSMINRDDAPDTLLIRRSLDMGTSARKRVRDAVRQSIQDAPHQSEILFELTNSPNILFTEKALLVEGKTEKSIFPELYAKIAGKTLDGDRVGLVQLGSSGSIPKSFDVLETMGVHTRAIVDLDFAYKIAPKHGLISEEDKDLIESLGLMQEMEDRGELSLSNDGLPMKGGGQTAAEGYELFARNDASHELIDSLHKKLKLKGVWLWKWGAIEPHLGLRSKEPSEHSRFLGTIEQPLALEQIPDFGGLNELVSWVAR